MCQHVIAGHELLIGVGSEVVSLWPWRPRGGVGTGNRPSEANNTVAHGSGHERNICTL